MEEGNLDMVNKMKNNKSGRELLIRGPIELLNVFSIFRGRRHEELLYGFCHSGGVISGCGNTYSVRNPRVGEEMAD